MLVSSRIIFLLKLRIHTESINKWEDVFLRCDFIKNLIIKCDRWLWRENKNVDVEIEISQMFEKYISKSIDFFIGSELDSNLINDILHERFY